MRKRTRLEERITRTGEIKSVKRLLIGLLAVLPFLLLGQRKKPEVPYVPTPEDVVAEMLRLAQVGPDDVIYDLGCGDGRIVITAAAEFGCTGVGIDIDSQRITESRKNAEEAGVSDKVQFFEMDLFEADISKASVVTLYLLSRINLKLRPKLFSDLKPGTRIVSHDFSMDNWEADAKTSVEATPEAYYFWDEHNVFFWIIPDNVTGAWKWKLKNIAGNKEFSMKLDQKFQMVTGEAFEGRLTIPLIIKDGKIRGSQLEFILERNPEGRTQRLHFKGTVQGNTMVGTVKIADNPEGKEIPWKAKRVPSTLRPIDISQFKRNPIF